MERRRLRKGTRSCWECKHRKVRCVFAAPTDSQCLNCKRRHTTCTSQAVPEQLVPFSSHQVHDRINRIESLVGNLLAGNSPESLLPTSSLDESTGRESNPTGTVFPQPRSRIPAQDVLVRDSSQFQNLWPRPNNAQAASSNHHCSTVSYGQSTECLDLATRTRVTQGLCAALPCPEDTKTIYDLVDSKAFYFHLLCVQSFTEIERRGPTPLKLAGSSAQLLKGDMHPVLMAREMVLIVLVLQARSPHKTPRLKETSRVIGARMIEAVSELVTKNESLQESMEALECLLFESIYWKSKGDLRRGWHTVRRAMLAAQILGINRPNVGFVKTIQDGYGCNPSYIWYRIVHVDRYLCLMLGLPQGSASTDVATDTALSCETALGRLNRLQATVASRIIERNTQPKPADHDEISREADQLLLRSANLMPEDFWLPPNFKDIEENSEQDFWETARVSAQVYHFSLLIHIHLPSLMRQAQDGNDPYSHNTCIHASREILVRHVPYRQFKDECSYRIFDYLALMAATILLLSHFNAQTHGYSNTFLAHQRLSDRATVRSVLDVMEVVAGSDRRFLESQPSQIIRCLLQVEAEAAAGSAFDVLTVYCPGTLPGEDDIFRFEKDGGKFSTLHICMPYFGQISIVSREVSDRVVAANLGQDFLPDLFPDFTDEDILQGLYVPKDAGMDIDLQAARPHVSANSNLSATMQNLI